MDIRQIRYALAVARERSFSKAAERLNISQSTISEQVRGLEMQIGFDLFRRTGRGVEATELGRTFLAQAERVASDLLSLIDVARRLKGLGRDSLRIGIGSGLAPAFLPKLFAPGVLPSDLQIEIRTAPTRIVFEDLQSERLDLGILIEVPPDRVPSGLVVTRMQRMEMVAIAAPGLSLPIAKGRLDLARIRDIPLIISEMSVGYGEVVSDLFGSLGLRPHSRITVDNVETMKTAVRVGGGLAIVPHSSVQLDADRGDLQVHHLMPACHVQTACYVSRQGLSRTKQGFVARAFAAFNNEPSGEASAYIEALLNDSPSSASP